ncbi:hypothetical protein ACSLOR_29125, partial [Klebsiella pneumoniae]|uniref:hypothetical protein n=1 Tax=Klebsiella pneumoniae TaxID=573 RepID=UPI003EDFD77E
HQAGTVLINGSQVQASILVTGGGQHATGKTIIQGDTTMTSQGKIYLSRTGRCIGWFVAGFT